MTLKILLVAASLLALPLVACGGESSRERPPVAAKDEGRAHHRWWIPPRHLTWYWQLRGEVAVESVQATVMDGFATTAAVVRSFHSRGQKTICHVDVGTAETSRPDYRTLPPAVRGHPAGPGRTWLDVRQLSILAPIMRSRFQRCREKGFDAVEPDHIDAYKHETGFPITAAQQRAYDEWVATEVHSLGMAVFEKNDAQQATALQPYFDGALVVCDRTRSCRSFRSYLRAGKPVLGADFSRKKGFCDAVNSLGIMGARFDVALDRPGYSSCWEAPARPGPLPRASPTPPPPGRWYAPTSLWNTPIPPHPAISARNATIIRAWARRCRPGASPSCLYPLGGAYTPAIWYAHRGTRKVAVRLDFPSCDSGTRLVPIPAGARPDPSSEGHMVVATTSGTEYDFWRAAAPNQSPKSPYGPITPCRRTHRWTAAVIHITNWKTGSGSMRFSVRGSGTPEGAGTILPEDTQQPPGTDWGHALAFSYNHNCRKGLRWCPITPPAMDEDGKGTNETSDIPEGARLQLDPSINCATWPSLIYEYQRQMCRTLQIYGMIDVDSNGGGIGIYVQQQGSTGGYVYPWVQPGNYRGFPNDLMRHFRVLAFNGEGGSRSRRPDNRG